MSDSGERQSALMMIGQFIQGELSEQDAERLLHEMEKNSRLVAILYDNFITDLWLEDLFLSERKARDIVIEPETEELVRRSIIKDENQVNQPEPVDPYASIFQGIDVVSEPERIILDCRSDIVKPPRKKQFWLNWQNDSSSTNTDRESLRKKHDLTEEKAKGKQFWFITRLCLFLSAICWFSFQGLNRQESETFHPVATVREQVDVVWSSGEKPRKRGQGLPVDKIRLESGLVELEFESGANVILEGPAEITLNGPNKAFCSLGRLSAHVPPQAVGFEIQTPFGTVVDRGTEFFLEVTPHSTELGTAKGLVEWLRGTSEGIQLSSGKVLLAEPAGNSVTEVATIVKYLSKDTFTQKVIEYTQKEKLKWEESNRVLDGDETLLARFDFSDATGTRVSNRSKSGQTLCPDLTLNRVDWSEGFLFGMKAARFGNQKSSATVDMTTTCDAMTLVAHVKFDSLRNWGNVIFAGAPQLAEQGDFIWQISKSGEIMFQVQTKTNGPIQTWSTGPVLSPVDFGVWFRLKLVADPKEKKISFYIDDRLIVAKEWDEPVPLRINRGILGNTILRKGVTENLFLDGSMAGFEIYKAPK